MLLPAEVYWEAAWSPSCCFSPGTRACDIDTSNHYVVYPKLINIVCQLYHNEKKEERANWPVEMHVQKSREGRDPDEDEARQGKQRSWNKGALWWGEPGGWARTCGSQASFVFILRAGGMSNCCGTSESRARESLGGSSPHLDSVLATASLTNELPGLATANTLRDRELEPSQAFQSTF